MAHESFEDEATAEEMNRLFVNIKVDREERPDVDSIYMEALQAMTGQGGWPMTVWLTPTGEPFFAGTYFPPVSRGGMGSFRQVIAAVDDAWRTRRGDLTEQANRVMESLRQEVAPGSELPGLEQLESALETLSSGFDHRLGGFGHAPKFPQQPLLEFLLRSSTFSPDPKTCWSSTLEAMARGGIHDQLAGGFSRYSVDAAWVVPHFEKMLYDNAQLVRLYLWAGLEAHRSDLVDTARRAIHYLLRDLCHPDGGLLLGRGRRLGGVRKASSTSGVTTSSWRSAAPTLPLPRVAYRGNTRWQLRGTQHPRRSASARPAPDRVSRHRHRRGHSQVPQSAPRPKSRADPPRARRQSGGSLERARHQGPSRGRRGPGRAELSRGRQNRGPVRARENGGL